MIVISDTTAISNLLTIEKEELLHALFGRVIIPPAVCAELLAWHADLPAWIEVITISDAARVERYRQSVHAGEAEAICLAAELNCDWLLLDDGDGRRLARSEGLPVLGLMGVLLLAKKQDLIPAVRTLIDRLRDQAGFFLTETVRQEVLRLAGE
jgi:predicted nucleic acid-binding protein